MRKLLLTLLALPAIVFGQVKQMSNHDRILVHDTKWDSAGRLLAWHQPDVPGAGYPHVALLAADFMTRKAPVDSKTGLPFFLIGCAFNKPDLNGTTFYAEEWPHNPACVYAGSVHSLAAAAYAYTGDAAYVGVVRTMLDYQLEHGTTPAAFKWPSVPYSSADPFTKEYNGATRWEANSNVGDGLHCLEPDKVGELGFGYLRFHQITGDQKYLDAALACADALAANVREISGKTEGLAPNVDRSPWPFRVNARTGVVISEYCSNALEPVRLMSELLRTADRISLGDERRKAYARARDLGWNWLFGHTGPMTTFIWNAYFEDIYNDPQRANRNQITPGELAKFLIQNPGLDPQVDDHVRAIVHWIRSAFKDKKWDAINEQTWCYEPMGSHTARYGSLCALYYERTGDTWYKDQAYRFLNFATYMTLPDGYVAVGPNWPGAWWSDGYSDYIRHFFDALGAVPEWAPAGENHLLRSDSAVQNVTYSADAITVQTYDSAGTLVFRLKSKPKAVTVDARELPPEVVADKGGFTWKPLETGGVLHVTVVGATKTKIVLGSE